MVARCYPRYGYKKNQGGYDHYLTDSMWQAWQVAVKHCGRQSPQPTLRDKFAMAAMAAHEPERLGLNPNEVAAYVYEIADTMLKEREK